MKEAMKLALEALEWCHGGEPCGTAEAIAAIKAALAQPVQEPDNGDELTIAYMSGVHRGKELAAQPAQEPVAWLEPEWREKICPEVGYEVTMTDDHPRDLCWIPLYPHPPQRTEQEPVAWMQVTKYGNKLLAFTEPPLEPPCYTEEFIAAKNYPLFLKKENT